MKPPIFVLCLGIALAALPQAILAHDSRSDRGSASIDRFVEVVRLVSNQWYDSRRSQVVQFAMEAAGAGRSESYVRSLDDLAQVRLGAAVRASGGNGDAAIERFMMKLDPWTSYLPPADYQRFQNSQREDYSGVGMDLEKEADGSFTCWPYPGSSAESAGIQPGAKLSAVAGIPTSGRSLYAIGAQVRGKRGTQVNLSVVRFLNLSSQLNILRQPAHIRTVFSADARNGVQVLRITRFAPGTPSELAAIISPSTPTVEIDLSKCSGGDLDAAVAAASMFLEQGRVIARIHRNGASETLRAVSGPRRVARLVLHQSGVTASAAEVFIAGLVENNAATSYGSTSKGKATTQDISPLRKGGAVLLTTGLIYGPGGRTWHGRGLPPLN